MKISIIETGLFKLDGGAMFGVVPQKMWGKIHPPDENGMCTWTMRCLLVETESRKILIDTGMGTKQDEKFRSHFEPHGPFTLMSSLEKVGCKPEDITDVFLTHLHFDHSGGALDKTENGEIVAAFPNATYWSNASHWAWAKDPNPREKASFLKENFIPLEDMNDPQSGASRLAFIPPPDEPYDFVPWIEGIEIGFAYGHTESLMYPIIPVNGRKLLFLADLMPSHFHISLPWVMSYDVRPLVTLKEKEAMLKKAAEEDQILFFEHDPEFAFGTVIYQDGKIILDKKFNSLD
jgi:glyoxylase-like metal-dependent hydrolase (beta-lactamase superfamily II)